ARPLKDAPPSCDAEGVYFFVCYAHADRSKVFPQLRRLAAEGARIWYDEGIHPASEWSDEIAEAIKGCALFVAMISPEAVASANVKEEIVYAADKSRDILAIHLVETELPDGLQLRLNAKQAILKWQLDRSAYERKLRAAVAQYTSAHVGDGEGHAGARTRLSNADETRRRRRRWMLSIAGAIACLVIVPLAIARAGNGSHAHAAGGGKGGGGPGTASGSVRCRNPYLGYQVTLPEGLFASGNNQTLTSCEAF